MASNIQMLAQLKNHTGLVTYLRPFETVLRVNLADNTAGCIVDTFRYDDRPREIRFTGHGEKLISFVRWTDTENEPWKFGRWFLVGQMTAWDPEEEFTPFIQIKFGKSVSPREYLDRLKWERDCYRPGNARNPLDNYARVLAGPTTPEMERYW